MENKASKVCRIMKSAGLLLTIGIWKPHLTVSFLTGFLADLWEYCLFPTLSQKQLPLCQASCTVWFGIRTQGMSQRRSHFVWSPLADWLEVWKCWCPQLSFIISENGRPVEQLWESKDHRRHATASGGLTSALDA